MENILWYSTGFDLRAFIVTYLCQWHDSSCKLKFAFIADDSCLIFQHKDVEEMEKVL